MTTSTQGSGLWSKQHAITVHLAQGSHGMTGEIADVRRDLLKVFAPLGAISVEEFSAPASASAVAVQAATATVVAGITYSVAGGTLIDLSTTFAVAARNLTFTTGGTTTAHAPASALITGFDAAGLPQTETVTPATTAALVAGVKGWSKITSIAFGAAGGTDATVSIGFGVVIGLKSPVKSRTGATTTLPPIREYVDAATPTAGSLDTTNKTYTPNTAPNGTHKYCVYYEMDAAQTL